MTQINNEANPAIRLQRILEQAQAFADGRNAYDGWAEVLGVSDKRDYPTFFRRLARLTAIVAGVRRDVEELDPDDAGYILEHYGEVEQVIDLFPRIATITMAEIMRPLSQQTGIYCVRGAARTLRTKPHLWTIPEEDVDRLKRAVLDARTVLDGESGVSGSDATWLRDLLDDLDDSLDMVSLDGPEEVVRVTDSLIGGLGRKLALIAQLANSPLGRSLAILAATATWIIATYSSVAELLPGTEPGPAPATTYIVNQLAPGAVVQIEDGQSTVSIEGAQQSP